MMAMRPRVSAMRRHREKNRAVDPVVTKITAHETTISLRSQVNARLTDPLGEIPGINAYSLAELPSGTHIFGGVPFDIRGLLQLNGTAENPNGRVLPAEIADIRIGQKLKKIHLLHGALNIPSPRFTDVIAKLVLHYADGSREEFSIASGAQVQIFNQSFLPPFLADLARGSALAWVGSNPYLRENRPDWGLHLFRTTLVNPRPNVEVTSVDYVSTMTPAAPFLAGLTVE
jgi:hypothetical protein